MVEHTGLEYDSSRFKSQRKQPFFSYLVDYLKRKHLVEYQLELHIFKWTIKILSQLLKQPENYNSVGIKKEIFSVLYKNFEILFIDKNKASIPFWWYSLLQPPKESEKKSLLKKILVKRKQTSLFITHHKLSSPMCLETWLREKHVSWIPLYWHRIFKKQLKCS